MSAPIRIIYSESRDKAAEFLRLALAAMARHEVLPHPHNYALWYEYVSGRNAELNKILDESIAAGEKLTEEQNQDLYLRFFVQDDQMLETTRQSLKAMILDIQAHIKDAGGNLTEYADTLGDYAQLLETSQDMVAIKGETNKVIDETKETEQSSLNLDSRLSTMVSEVESLRKELEYIREESLTDGLTGIGNRKAFDIGLAQAVRDARDKRIVFSVLMADIDHFKQFNDNYGHLTGDRVLRYVSNQLRQCLKGHDKPFRYGGEEFAVILPKTALHGAATLAEQIRQDLSGNELKNKSSGQSYGHISISIGVAQFRNGEDATDLIHRVDKALYKAKQTGRNRVMKAD